MAKSELEKAIIKYLRGLKGVKVEDKTASELVARDIVQIVREHEQQRQGARR